MSGSFLGRPGDVASFEPFVIYSFVSFVVKHLPSPAVSYFETGNLSWRAVD